VVLACRLRVIRSWEKPLRIGGDGRRIGDEREMSSLESSIVNDYDCVVPLVELDRVVYDWQRANTIGFFRHVTPWRC